MRYRDGEQIMDAQEHVEAMVEAHAPFEHIEAYIEGRRDLEAHAKSALWLFAWAETDRDTRREVTRSLLEEFAS
jgi:hypothetical protein